MEIEVVKVEITDESGGLMYIQLAEGEIVGTKEVAPGVILDYTRDRRIVGIEVLYLDKPGVREASDLAVEAFLDRLGEEKTSGSPGEDGESKAG